MDRRDFFKVSGGLAFAFTFPVICEANVAKPLNAWVRIAPDGTVTILSTGAEMGQGSMTSLPLILADEMDADWSKVKIEWAPADPTTYGYTFQNDESDGDRRQPRGDAVLQRPANRRRPGPQGHARQCR